MSDTSLQKKRVVVCDDDAKRVKDWVRRLAVILPEEEYEIRPLSTGEFAEAIHALHGRLRAAKAGEEVILDDGARVFDEADFVVIDSDLTPDPSVVIDESAEEAVDEYLVGEYGSNVARLARGYSEAGLLIVVNHIYKGRTFDLTMRRFAELPADAYVAAPDIDNAGLWFGRLSSKFRPWSWPNLAQLAASASAGTPTKSLDASVVDVIGLGKAQVRLLEDKQWERLLFDFEEPATATLRDVGKSAVFGLGPQSNVSLPNDQLVRVAMSALRRWLTHIVIPAQNVFVDLPHLIQDRPWLARSARKDASSLNALIERSWADPAEILTEAHAATASAVLGLSVWHSDLVPTSSPTERLDSDDLVFCEDTSDFRPVTSAREFSSDIDGQYRSRFVAKLPDVEYTPIRRLFAR